MNKKAESISMSVIIIAAIALLVLVVLAVLVLKSGNSIISGTSCAGIGGSCQPESCDAISEEQGGVWTVDYSKRGKSGGCQDDTYVCCKRIASAPEE